MKIYRLIAPDWLIQTQPQLKKVQEGIFTDLEIQEYNTQGYNIYYLPNYPSEYAKGVTVEGSMIETFNYVFVDCDLKDKVYADKEQFLEKVGDIGIMPTKVVDSGNGIHVYWAVSDLDAMSYLRFQRRLLRLFNTDESVATLYQLMRVENTLNTKNPNNLIPCEVIFETNEKYTIKYY